MRLLIVETSDGAVVLSSAGVVSTIIRSDLAHSFLVPYENMSKLMADFDDGKRVLRANIGPNHVSIDDRYVVVQAKGFYYKGNVKAFKEAHIDLWSGGEVF